MAGANKHEMERFSLGKPALVCRWRLAAGTLLLENRHLRALSRRSVNGRPISAELVAWAKQHVEWTLAEGSYEHPDGVLMLIVDEAGAAAMTAGPYEPLPQPISDVLISRARAAAREQDETDVAPEVLFVHADDTLRAAISPDASFGGCASLVLQLSATLGIPVVYDPALLGAPNGELREADGMFLASDEHGIVCASDRADVFCKRFEASYQRLFDSAHAKRR